MLYVHSNHNHIHNLQSLYSKKKQKRKQIKGYNIYINRCPQSFSPTKKKRLP